MLISSVATGGQIVSAGEDPSFYDDIGCLAADAARAVAAGTRAYVRTAAGTWVDAEAAAYARPEGAQTPMGSGVLAYETADAARAAAPGAEVLTWNDVVAREAREAQR